MCNSRSRRVLGMVVALVALTAACNSDGEGILAPDALRSPSHNQMVGNGAVPEKPESPLQHQMVGNGRQDTTAVETAIAPGQMIGGG